MSSDMMIVGRMREVVAQLDRARFDRDDYERRWLEAERKLGDALRRIFELEANADPNGA